MKKNNIDKLFKEKIEVFNNLSTSKNIKWNKKDSWKNYTNTFHKKHINLNKKLLYISSTAAIILILISIIFFNNNSYNNIVVENNTNEIKKIILPDGNLVWLNKNTKITYPSKIEGQECFMNIDGEAYFEINKKRCASYIITAQNAVISVELPSQINIKAYKKNINVDITVKNGIIKVEEANNKEGFALLIKKGHFCSVNKTANLVFASKNQNENYLTWKTGIFVFNDTPIITVTDLLTEYYGTKVEVQNENIAYCLISTHFENLPLDKILNELKTLMHLDIINTGNKIILTGEGC